MAAGEAVRLLLHPAVRVQQQHADEQRQAERPEPVWQDEPPAGRIPEGRGLADDWVLLVGRGVTAGQRSQV